MRKIHIFFFLLLVLAIMFIFKYLSKSEDNISLDLPIISELHDAGISESLFIQKANKLDLQFKEGGMIFDPDFKKGIIVYAPDQHIDRILCGFNYDNHLFCLDYYYKTTVPKENIDKQINNLRSYYIKMLGKPYSENKKLISNKNITYCGIVWFNKEWTTSFISIAVSGNNRIINVKYSCWPKGDRLKQFPDQ